MLTSFISGEWGWVGAFAAQAADTATDSEGNVYAVGTFAGADYNAPLDFDPGPDSYSVSPTGRDPAYGNAFLVKFNPEGAFQWVRTLSVQYGRVSFSDIEVAADGTLRIVGSAYNQHVYLTSTINVYAPATSAETLASLGAGQTEAFACNFTDSGTFQWLTILPRGGLFLQDSALDPTDGSLVVGRNSESLIRVSAAGVIQYSPVPYSRLSDLGGTLGGLSVDRIEIDAYGNTFLAGRLRGGADFDPSANSYDLYSTWKWGWDTYYNRQIRHWSDDVFVAKYSVSGALEWVTLQGVATIHETLEHFVLRPTGDTATAIAQSIYNNRRIITSFSGDGLQQWSEEVGFDDTMVRLIGLTPASDGSVVLVTSNGLVNISPGSDSLLAWRARIYEGNVSGSHFDSQGRAVVWSAGPVGYGNRWPNTRMDASGGFPLVFGTANNGGASSFPGTYIAVLDTAAPRVASIARHLPTSRVTAASTLQFLVTFTEAVSGVDAADFSVQGSTATASAVDAQPDGSYLVTVTGGDLATVNGVVSLSLNQESGISDAALNALVDPTPQGSDEDFLLDHASPTASIQPVSPSPRNSAVTEVAVTFTEPVLGLNAAAFRLTKDGTPVSLANADVTGAGDAWTLGNLASLTSQSGNYELALVAAGSGVTDDAGNLLTGESKITWTVDGTKPTASFAAVTPPLRNTAVVLVDIAFSEAIQGLDALDFALTRNGVTVSLGSAAVFGSGKSWTLSGLSTATDANGDYVLELGVDATVTDALGNTLAAGTSVAWTTDKTAPQASLANVSPAVRSTPVQSLAVSFTKPVSSVTAAAFRVERDGVALPLSGLSVSGQGTEWLLTGLGSLTAAQGAYKLTLAGAGSGITDTAGNGLIGTVDVTWQTDTTRPTVVLPSVSPSLRNTPVAGRRLTFSESVQNLGLEDFVLTRNGLPVSLAQASLTGDADKWTLSGLTSANSQDGVYSLSLTNAAIVSDAAGNLVNIPTPVSWTIDRTVPTAVFTAVSPTLRNTAVSEVGISFSEPVVNVAISDLILTRDGTSIPLTGASVSGSGRNWTVNGLGSLTATSGTHVLTFKPSNGIADAAGNTLGNVQATGWEHLLTVAFGQIPATNKVVARSIGLTFNAAVTGVTLGNVQLTRNGKAVKLVKTNGVSLTGSGNRYVLTLPASIARVKGTYVLSLGGPTSPITMGLRTLSQRFSATWRYL